MSVKYPSSISILARSTTAASVETKGRYPHAEGARRHRSTSPSALRRMRRGPVLRHRIGADLCPLRAPVGHRQIEPTECRHKQCSPRSRGRGHVCHWLVVIGILLGHNTQRTCTTSAVNAPLLWIIEQIVRIAHTLHAGTHMP